MAMCPTTARRATARYDPPLQQFNLLHGMTIARDGIVYVADRNANRVQAFTLDGKFLKEAWVSRVIAAGRFRHRLRRGAVRRQGAAIPLCRRRA